MSADGVVVRSEGLMMAGSVREHRTTSEIVNDGTFAYALYGINLEVPDAGSSQVVALGWTHGDLLKLSGDSWAYMGIKIPNASKGTVLYDTVKERLQVAAHGHGWTQSDVVGWVWWDYLPLRADETNLDGYATRQLEELVAAWQTMRSAI